MISSSTRGDEVQGGGASAYADRATAVEPVPVSPLRDGIPSAAAIEQMIAEERFLLVALTDAYQAGVLDYVHFSPAWDTTACRVEALTRAAQAMSAREGQDPQGLGAKPASAVGSADAPECNCPDNGKDGHHPLCWHAPESPHHDQ